MKKNYLLVLFLTLTLGVFAQDLKITGVIDGPLPGGLPKAIEFYVANDIADLSAYGIGSANNGGGSDGEEFTFPATTATSGSYIYLASEAVEFNNFFGFAPDYEDSAANVNGDDAIELFYQGTVIDTFGDIDVDGNGQPWEYLDGWAYRKNGTGPDGATFILDNWVFSGPDALDTATSNATAASPFPIGTFGGGGTTLIANPTSFATTVQGTTAIDLTWALNADNDAVVLAVSTAPITASLVDGQTYTTGETLSDGSTVLTTGNPTLFQHSGLSPNTEYFYKLWSVTPATEYSLGVAISARTESDTPVEAGLVITGAIDGPLSGGTPKAVELYAATDIPDLSVYGIGSANNGGGSDGQEFTFPADALQAGQFIYVTSETEGFTDFFGFAPDYTTGAMGINGDDAVELFLNGSVIDVFGAIDTDGSGEAWDHLDGWAYRKDEVPANNGSFDSDNWIFSGINALDGELTNATAATPFPLQSYGPDLMITGIVDGPLSGGVPKAVELYARNSIADLSLYGFGSANNGGGSDGEEFTFPAVAVPANTYIYLATDIEGFTAYFGFAPDYTSNSVSVNGDDAVELFYKGGVIDTFGDINVNGSGQTWDYLDGWAYRKDGTLNNGAFVLDDWTYSGTDVLDGSATNGTASLPFPIGTFGGGDGGTENPDPISISDARAAADGTLVSISGILTVADEFSGSAYIQDETGAIAVFDEKVHGKGVFQVGDSITLVGVRSSYNEQLQISPITEVINNGTPNNPIEPLEITLDQLSQYPGQLVKVANLSFPSPGNLLFGDSNYLVSDASGSGELRIDNDVEALVGLAQPESCDEVIGVVGRFYEFYQLLPRNRSDLACAQPYEAPTLPIEVDADQTLEIATWNIEWFGDEGNSPAAGSPDSDAIQKDSVKAVIQSIAPDIMAVQEISDDALFATMVSELEGYDYILSPATSYPNDPGVSQKVGFIYKTDVVSITDTQVLLESIHPYYNGGDTSFLTDYPSDADRFYASGRLPFLISTTVTIDSTEVAYDFVALHARANSSSGAQERYDMRKYDVEVLRDSLNQYYADSNLVVFGDYNDDVDETVADDVASTASTYEAYVSDTANFDILTDVLSEQGFRSYAFRENMIDHILVTDELAGNYIDQSAQVHYEFYDSDYTQTASDHFPVSVRMLVNPFVLDSIAKTDVSCYGENNGRATVYASGGLAPYTYVWSNGASTPTVEGLEPGEYSVQVSDALQNSFEAAITVYEPSALELIVSEDTTVTIGYGNENCTTLGVLEVMGGEGSYTYEWSTGETTEQIAVCPEETTTYTVTVTDENGCSASKAIEVAVDDVSCGNNPRNPKVQVCYKGRTLCISKYAVSSFLRKGASLGSCEDLPPVDLEIKVSPNPFRHSTTIAFSEPTPDHYLAVLYNTYGRWVYSTLIPKNTSEKKLYPFYLRKGVYVLSIYDGRDLVESFKLIKE
ncbi:endonuclease/exonuclease/phosphatase family protein [Zobellia galactanivorans]|uniref:endonuclease/exonuclease/phosphatase family protein n=1 Tax=Zobellia galactanivorans (strain DSM 12802 / CCUG 47099 / CIP 106680 / NCIMB 13871 / Dsij) TaxID=63186 RepID=UPI0026E2E1FC|nr:endonuclease/exonuclease/phosphatase family protein [Zobellia galactanivorans]MDO6810092.1 endonuclease/exonuclease/phosphatase family protein [Zobellia galactanivorans]